VGLADGLAKVEDVRRDDAARESLRQRGARKNECSPMRSPRAMRLDVESPAGAPSSCGSSYRGTGSAAPARGSVCEVERALVFDAPPPARAPRSPRTSPGSCSGQLSPEKGAPAPAPIAFGADKENLSASTGSEGYIGKPSARGPVSILLGSNTAPTSLGLRPDATRLALGGRRAGSCGSLSPRRAAELAGGAEEWRFRAREAAAQRVGTRGSIRWRA